MTRPMNVAVIQADGDIIRLLGCRVYRLVKCDWNFPVGKWVYSGEENCKNYKLTIRVE